MDKDFLLDSDAAKKLYHDFAAKMPVVDYHCHIDPKEIFEDKHYPNIAQLWLGVGGSHFGDHYKWRLMRSFGVEERFITGTEPDRERFRKWAACLGRAIGNPLYHWSHLELRKYFGYEGILNENTWEEVWDLCNEKLKDPDMGVRGLILMSDVRLICTTDDPADSLVWHEKIAADDSFPVSVLPAWRPDKAMNIEKPDYTDYIRRLEQVSGRGIAAFADLKKALTDRMDFFADHGCRVSDHALEYVMYEPLPDEEIEEIFRKRLEGAILSEKEALAYKTAFMLCMAGEYRSRGWVMQLHYGAKRDNNAVMYAEMGPDTGFDSIRNNAPSAQLADFLDAVEQAGGLPKTILYSLDPSDNAAIGTVIGCFQNSSAVSRLQQGSAWWFNDHRKGMREQLISLANLGNLSGFVGMLTDSRSFLSYTRHDYFRRILCQLFGEWITAGEYPEDYETAGSIVKDISYNNAVRYFGFNLETE